jgi:hypothetical protein
VKKQAIEWTEWRGPAHGKIVRGPHQMTQKCLNWRYCARCGLMNLKNDATRKALRQECVTEE